MGKQKKQSAKQKISEKLAKKSAKKPVNPFEIRFTKEKHSVLGRSGKLGKDGFVNGVGKPGVARSKALNKRKKSLLLEYKDKNKSNVFRDNRLGEGDADLSLEDKMLARFKAQRLHGKSSIFNLDAQETLLTHMGKSLNEIERFEDPRSDDENDDDDKKLDSSFVDKVHFGGFMEKTDEDFAAGKGNTRKDWIDSMISDSRKRKLEKQKNIEEAVSMTQDLDSKWKELMPNLRSSGLYTKKFTETDDSESKKDSYDILMRQLGLEPKKAKATERLKTDEEIIQDEKEKLEKLEQERQQRMKGDLQELDDIQFDDDEEEEEEENEKEDKDSDEEEDEDDECEEDKYSDLDEEEDEKMDVEVSKSKKKKCPSSEEKNVQEKAKNEIPFTFSVPDSYEELLTHFEGRYLASDIGIIVSRIIKCNHPQFGENNKAKLENLFTFLLQYVHDCATGYDPSETKDARFEKQALKHLDAVVPYLYDISKFSPQFCAKSILNVIHEKYLEFKRQPKRYPTLDTIVFFKIAFLLFPTSDYRHPVVTPSLQFISHVLSTSRVNNRSSIATGLILSTFYIECVSLSKRYSSELMNFLNGIVYMCVPKGKSTIVSIVPPFKVVGRESELLVHTNVNSNIIPGKLNWSDVLEEEDDSSIEPKFIVNCLSISINLINELVELWRGLPSANEIFSSKYLELLPLDKFHPYIRENVKNLKHKISSLPTVKRALQVQTTKKPSILRLLEPEFDDDFDPFNKKRKGNKDKLEKDKLLHKLKREKKGAKKDIRADSAFLAKTKAKEAREKDLERQRKTNEILAGLGSQEGDYRKMLKEKNKKNRK